CFRRIDGVTTVSARASAGWQPIPARNVDFRPPCDVGKERRHTRAHSGTFFTKKKTQNM
ncbi:unnamed protein product, partial [Nesidiocoris tenuis]